MYRPLGEKKGARQFGRGGRTSQRIENYISGKRGGNAGRAVGRSFGGGKVFATLGRSSAGREGEGGGKLDRRTP